MAVTLYKRQRQIVDFIAQYIQRNGYSPTLSEIAQALGVSSLATVHEHLQALIKKKIIRRYEGAVRGIELLDKTIGQVLNTVELPILGYIAAGSPILPHTDPNATLRISPTLLTGRRKAFILQVNGNSMIEAGILPDDYVVCEETPDAHDGDIVVALLENGLATLKRFYKEKTRVRLEPANSAMTPIYARQVQIQGKVVGVIRQYQ